MKIVKVISQYRRDFRALYECEGCGATEESSGYDDRNFHDNVIPGMKCVQCNKSREDLGIKAQPTATKYGEHEVV